MSPRYVQTKGRPHKGQRLHIVGTIGEKVSELVFRLYFEFSLPWSRSSRAGIGMTNLTITLPLTLDVTPPASRADRLFSIAFAVQCRERTSRARDSRGVRTLTNDLQRGIYLREMFMMDRRAFEKH